MPIIVVSGPVIVENGRVLVNKHGDTSFWKFCGGRVEDFSSDLHTQAAREAREEMGIELAFAERDPFVMWTQKISDNVTTDVLLVHYLAERHGEIHPGSDIREWAWIALDELPKDLGPNIIPALHHFGFLK